MTNFLLGMKFSKILYLISAIPTGKFLKKTKNTVILIRFSRVFHIFEKNVISINDISNRKMCPIRPPLRI